MSAFTLDIRNFVEKAKKNPETVARSVSFRLFSPENVVSFSGPAQNSD